MNREKIREQKREYNRMNHDKIKDQKKRRLERIKEDPSLWAAHLDGRRNYLARKRQELKDDPILWAAFQEEIRMKNKKYR